MASARQSSLYERRYQYQSPFSGETRRILAPRSVGLSSVVRQQASGELDVMISRYNNGLIGNEEMKSFLTSQANNQYLSESDRAQVQEKLVDFDALIEKDRLEAVFKAAPEASLEKANAAIALSEFYTKRASSMVPGTPAYLQAQENAATWSQNVQAIQESVNKKQLSNYETSMMQQINTLQTSSSERSSAMATMYSKLADLATQQGDQETANEYIAKQRQQETIASQYAAEEQEQMTKTEMKQYIAEQEARIAQMPNNTAEEIAAKRDLYEDIANKYAEMGDQYNADKYAAKYYDASEKYEKKAAATSASSAASASAQAAKDYSDNIRLAQERYINGQYDSSQFTSPEEEYKDSLSHAVNEWKETIGSIRNLAYSMDANEKISWNGKTRRVGDVIDEIDAEYAKVDGLDNAIQSGTVMLKELPVSSKMGKNVPKYELVDIRNISDEESYLLAPDETGILHSGEMKMEEISQKDFEDAKLSGEAAGYTYNSKTGRYYRPAGIKFTVVDPETGQSYVQSSNEQGKVLSYRSIRDEARKLGYKDTDIIDFDPEKAARVTSEQAAMTQQEVAKSREKAKKIQLKQEEKGLINQVAQKTDTILPRITQGARTVGEQLKDTAVAVAKSPTLAAVDVGKNLVGELANTNVGEKINQTIQPAVQKVQQAVQPTVQRVQQAAQPAVQQVQKAVQPAVNTAQQVYNKLPEPIKQAPIVAAYNYVAPKVQQAVAPVVQKAKDTAQKIATTVTSTSPFSWLKSKLGW